jgi:hypothetical protein
MREARWTVSIRASIDGRKLRLKFISGSGVSSTARGTSVAAPPAPTFQRLSWAAGRRQCYVYDVELNRDVLLDAQPKRRLPPSSPLDRSSSTSR